MDTALGSGHAGEMDRTVTPRQLAREEMERRILASARRQLADVGPAQLSLRAVARELGVASSAVYRYVESREELITRLILEVYGELGDVIEEAAAAVDAGDRPAQWRTWATTLRAWALAHPYDWALVYGTPIPGYRAPRDTVAPAVRVNAPILDAGGLHADALGPEDASAAASLAPFVASVGAMGPTITPGSGFAMMTAWSAVHGFINLELGGHFVGGMQDTTAVFEALIRRTSHDLGLTPRGPRPQ